MKKLFEMLKEVIGTWLFSPPKPKQHRSCRDIAQHEKKKNGTRAEGLRTR
jgi:hypothetical protein